MNELQKELDAMLQKRDRIRSTQFDRMVSGGSTRARTTTSNAEASRVNDRIVWLREEIARIGGCNG